MHLSLVSVPAPAQTLLGESQFVGTVRRRMHKAPLTALAAGLEEHLHDVGVKLEVRIVDLQLTGAEAIEYGELSLDGLALTKYRVGGRFEDAAAIIRWSDVIGVNSNFTHSRTIVKDFLSYARQENPSAILVVGGTDATADPAFYLTSGCNIVVRGEGERTLVVLLQCIDKRGDLNLIPNITYSSEHGVVQTKSNFLHRSNIVDVNGLRPPALHLVDLQSYDDTGEGAPPEGVYGPFLSVETSRGCAQACSFCATPSSKGRFRFMSNQTAQAHLEHIRAMGVRTILFQEDNLLSRLQRVGGVPLFPDGRDNLIALFQMARKMGFSWEFTNGLEFGQFIGDQGIDQELIETMFWSDTRNGNRLGCYRATIPLESLTDEADVLFRKLKPLTESMAILKCIAATGIHALSFNVIIGRPSDTAHSLQLTFDRCLEIRRLCELVRSDLQVYFNIYTLSLLPGTADYRNFIKLLDFDIYRDPEVITFYLGSLRTDAFSPREITEARGTMALLLNGESLNRAYDETRFITSDRFRRLFGV